MRLRRRLNTALLQWFLLLAVFAASVWALSLPALQRTVIADRQILARTVAHAIDDRVSASIQSLSRLASELPQADALSASHVRPFRFESVFSDAIYIVDSSARVIAADPSDCQPVDMRSLGDRERVTARVTKPAGADDPVTAIVEPFVRDGRQFFLVAEMKLARSGLHTFLKDLKPAASLHVDVIDANGGVIASDEPPEAIRAGSAVRPNSELAVTAPLQFAPWHVVIRQPRAEAFVGLFATGRGLALTGLVVAVTGVLLARTLTRSVVSPIRHLSRQAEGMRSGDLKTPITVTGDHEIATLARTLDEARVRLSATLMELQAFNHRLEEQVAARTRVIVEQDDQRKVLLRRMMHATEDERRRLARELHDEIAQLLTVVQLSLHHINSGGPELARANALLVRTQQEIHRIIHDLRPALLDDLGLATAMKSYADDHLRKNGVAVSVEIDEPLTSVPEIETVVFRIYQELITNILRHANAEHVSIELYQTPRSLVLAVEDDGRGFDPEARSQRAGLTGMRERAALVNGTITFDSEPGLGTHVLLEIPTS